LSARAAGLTTSLAPMTSELLEQLAGGGVAALIGHDVVFFQMLSYGLAG